MKHALILYFIVLAYTAKAQAFVSSTDSIYAKLMNTYSSFECFQLENGGCRIKQSRGNGLFVTDIYLSPSSKRKVIAALLKAKKWIAINKSERMSFEKTVGCFDYWEWSVYKTMGASLPGNENCVTFLGSDSGESQVSVWSVLFEPSTFTSRESIDKLIYVLKGISKDRLNEKFR